MRSFSIRPRSRPYSPPIISSPLRHVKLSHLLAFLLSSILVLYIILLISYHRPFDSANDASTITSERISSQKVVKPPIPQKEKKKIIKSNSPVATIAYAVSLTACNPELLGDGAAIVKHSIHLNSFPTHAESRYAYQMFAFIHPSAVSCSQIFERLQYHIRITETPVNITDIRGDFLREHVVRSGCCGEKEYIKLYSYTLIEYPIVVHLDLDSLILQPLDDLFHFLLKQEGGDHSAGGNVVPSLPRVMWETSLLPPVNSTNVQNPIRTNAFFTRDYNMVHIGHKHVGVQGGFLVVRPDLHVFEEYRQIILEGDFVNGVGWKGKYGGYFGAQQIQGICSYFYDGVHPGTAIELNRCIYNSMGDSPYGHTHKGVQKCRDGREICEDCRLTDITKIKSVHFTICQKPWLCPTHSFTDNSICKEFHHKWFQVREDFDKSIGVSGTNIGNHHREVYMGYCTKGGRHGYIPISLPSSHV